MRKLRRAERLKNAIQRRKRHDYSGTRHTTRTAFAPIPSYASCRQNRKGLAPEPDDLSKGAANT
jgi:hypothetical protein